jgi:hypothetical protein
VAGDADTAMEDLDRSRRGAHLHSLPGQLIRNAVVVPVVFNVIVNVYASGLPVAELIPLSRQRAQRGLVHGLE